MVKPADQLAQYKLSATDPLNKNISSVQESLGDTLNNAILHPLRPGQKPLSVKDKILDHDLGRQRFSLRFLALIVLPSTFLVGVIVADEKIKTSCFGMVSLIVGALIQESGNQKNPKVEEDDEK